MNDASDPPRRQYFFVATGLSLAGLMGVFQIVNAVRVLTDVVGFSEYMGLPVAPGSEGFVHVYALRSVFIGLMVLGLVAWRRVGVLAWMAVVALLLPLGDMWLVSAAGAPTHTVARHGAIAVYLVVTAFVLIVAARKQ